MSEKYLGTLKGNGHLPGFQVQLTPGTIAPSVLAEGFSGPTLERAVVEVEMGDLPTYLGTLSR